MALKTTYAAGDPLPAEDVNDIAGATLQNAHNVLQIIMERDLEGKDPEYLGLFYDTFEDSSKAASLVGVKTTDAATEQLQPSSLVDEAGDGSDGDLNVTSGTTTINTTVAKIDASASSGQKIVSVTSGDEAGFSSGDKVLIINNRNATEANAGFQEINEVDTTAAGQITMVNNLANTYVGDATDNASGNKAQIIKIPQYDNVTISGGSLTAPAWDGLTGGVLVFFAKSGITHTGGNITMSAKGFYGGGNDTGTWGVAQGESTTGKGTNSSSVNQRGGGGGGNVSTGGGGGGGYGTAGTAGSGSSVGAGGNAHGVASLAQLYMGSGGGKNSASGTSTGSDGGDGGGIIYFITPRYTKGASGSLTVAGGAGQGGVNAGCGGGSGGSILIRADEITFAGTCTAAGGAGGGGTNPGGAGGDGRIAINSDATVSGTTTPSFSATAATITLTAGSGGTYTSNKISFTQAVRDLRLWIKRKVNSDTLVSTITNGATSLVVTGDQTAQYADGDVLDVYVGTDATESRERVTISGAPVFSTNTTITFTPSIAGSDALDTVERVDARVRVSLVDSGAGDSFEAPTYVRSVVEASGDTEDEYSLSKGTDRHDLKAEVTLDRNDTALALYARRLGITLQ